MTSRAILDEIAEPDDLALRQALGWLIHDEQCGRQRQTHGHLKLSLVRVGQGRGGLSISSASATRAKDASTFRRTSPASRWIRLPMRPHQRLLDRERDIVVAGQVLKDAGDLEGIDDPAARRCQLLSSVTSRSLKKMRPEDGRMRPLIMLARVVLPAPFGPMTARISPWAG